jgi:hypothetical protein
MIPLLLSAAFALLVASETRAQTIAGWLDRPITVWNTPGAAIPRPPSSAEPLEGLLRRCRASAKTIPAAADAALGQAGWVPFLHLDRPLTRDDVEIVGGMSSAGPGCEASTFNLFVFVGGRFAGTLSPAPMTAARDGVAGAVRITAADAVAAEFARYGPQDAECCPSSRVRVLYRIDRNGSRPAVVATEARQIR